eukprot:4938767-Amphidinium_carterae.1
MGARTLPRSDSAELGALSLGKRRDGYVVLIEDIWRNLGRYRLRSLVAVLASIAMRCVTSTYCKYAPQPYHARA